MGVQGQFYPALHFYGKRFAEERQIPRLYPSKSNLHHNIRLKSCFEWHARLT